MPKTFVHNWVKLLMMVQRWYNSAEGLDFNTWSIKNSLVQWFEWIGDLHGQYPELWEKHGIYDAIMLFRFDTLRGICPQHIQGIFLKCMRKSTHWIILVAIIS